MLGGRPQTVRKALDLGLRVVFFQVPALLRPGQAELAHATLLVDYTDWSVLRPFAVAAHEVYGFTRVVSLAEQAMVPVAQINELLGLPGTRPEVARLFRDKWAMRQHLAGSGPGAVAARLYEDAASLREFGADHGYPFVVKPVDATGGRGVLRVDGPEEAEEVARRIDELRRRADLPLAQIFPLDRFVMEELVDGPEYSVETMSFDGRHVAVAVTEKLTAGFVEAGHAVPARLAAADEAAVVDHVTGFLDAVGLRQGLAHTEVRLSAQGPRLIESHDRSPGGRIMDLVEAACGIDLELYSVAWPFGLVPALAGRPVATRAAATRFLFPPAGEVVAVHGIEDVQGRPELLGLDVDVAVGGTVPAAADNFDRVGQVLAVGADTGAAVQAVEELAAKITIVTREPGVRAVTECTERSEGREGATKEALS